jgi:hypothetical protein
MEETETKTDTHRRKNGRVGSRLVFWYRHSGQRKRKRYAYGNQRCSELQMCSRALSFSFDAIEIADRDFVRIDSLEPVSRRRNVIVVGHREQLQ